jgi:uncharacterized RDD family membrane protein YckC
MSGVPAPPPPAVNGTGSAYAGLATRIIAFAADAAVINVVAWTVGLVLGLALSLFNLDKDLETLLAVVGGFLAIVWSIAYFTFFWSTTGQTPGCRLMSIEVRMASGEEMRARRAFVRVLALTLDILTLGVGLLMILFDRRRRALHDRVVGSVVVYVFKVPRAQVASTSPPPSSATRRPNRISAG